MDQTLSNLATATLLSPYSLIKFFWALPRKRGHYKTGGNKNGIKQNRTMHNKS